MINFSLIKDMDTNTKNFEMYREYIVSIDNLDNSIKFIRSILDKYIEDGKLFELLEIIYLINICVEKYGIKDLSSFNDILEDIYQYHKNIKVKILYLTSCLDLNLEERCNNILAESDNSEKEYLECILLLHRKQFELALESYSQISNKEKYPSLFAHILKNIEINQKTVVSINKIIFALIKSRKYTLFLQAIEQYLTIVLDHEYLDIATFIKKIGNIKNNQQFIKDFVTYLVDIENFQIAKNIIQHIAKDASSSTLIAELNNILLSKIGVSLVVACMNREDNLIQSLESWLNVEYIKEFIIIDYSSNVPLLENKNIKKWSKSHNINVIRVEGERTFNLGKAYNIGFDIAKENYILKIDSDYKLINADFLDNLLLNKNMRYYFVKADFRFSSSMSGFFLIHKDNLLPFREDLNGYGFDEIDLHNRIKHNKPQLQEIIWFNIEKSIYHIPHTNIQRGVNYYNKDIITTEQNNRYMCSVHSPINPTRKNYRLSNNTVQFNTNEELKVVCINLAERLDRWNKVKNIPSVERFDAIKTDKQNYHDILQKYQMSFQPVNLTAKYYFNEHHGAFGAYLSHYSIWENIVENEWPYTLILEDDVDVESVIELLNSNVIFNNHELIQLSLRMHWYENRMIFNGGESYILSLSGAKKLISATNCPTLLNYIKPAEEDFVINYYANKNIYNKKYNWSGKRSITCPVDKFIGYCCEERANDFIRIKSYLYPFVKLNENLARESSIESGKIISVERLEQYG